MAKRRRKGGRRFRFNFSNKFALSPEIKHSLLVVVVLLLAVLMIMSLFGLVGPLGGYLLKGLKIIFGRGYGIFPFVLLIIGILIIDSDRFNVSPLNYLGLIILILSYSGLFHSGLDVSVSWEAVRDGLGGGYVGWFITAPLFKIMGYWGTVVVLLAMLVVGIFITFNLSFQSILRKLDQLKYFRDKIISWWYNWRQKSSLPAADSEEGDEDEEDEEDEDEEDEEEVKTPEFSSKKFITSGKQQELEMIQSRHPVKIELPIHLLNPLNSKPTSGDIQSNKEKIRKTFESFGIDVEMGGVSVGPTVTQYTLRPSNGVKLASITALHNDIALALAAHPIRIEAPIPGKSLVGIEVPNQSIATVSLREIIDSKSFKNSPSPLTIGIGKDVAGRVWTGDLAKMPHLLIAGATGSGKSVCINTILISLLYKNNPEDLKFILVDPKRVELNHYNDLPYLLTSVITDIQKTINALKWAVGEMDQRYIKLSQAGARNLEGYNSTHPQEKMPYITIVIDELADLMSVAAPEVEAAIIRLAQMARAVGIHLILATQRPSVDVITGLIKANITSRIAFAVASQTDSRTILDNSGAEKLLGRGDMLFISAEVFKPKRLQGAFVSSEEVARITEYIKKQAGQVNYDQTITEHKNKGLGGASYGGEEDDRLVEARELVIKTGKASASYLQRRLRVGYARAARLLDLLEEEGVIGPADGAKPREVLITAEEASEYLAADSGDGIVSNENMVEVEEDDINKEDKGEGKEIEEEEENDDNEWRRR